MKEIFPTLLQNKTESLLIAYACLFVFVAVFLPSTETSPCTLLSWCRCLGCVSMNTKYGFTFDQTSNNYLCNVFDTALKGVSLFIQRWLHLMYNHGNQRVAVKEPAATDSLLIIMQIEKYTASCSSTQYNITTEEAIKLCIHVGSELGWS